MGWRGALRVVIVAAVVAGCSTGERGQPERPAPGAVEGGVGELDPPAIEGAFAPDLWADEQGLVASWLEPLGAEREDGHRVRFARLLDGEWTDPATIVEGDHLFANWADIPSVARAADGALYAHWLAKTADETYAYSIFLARSDDGGATWQELGKLNDDDTHTEHGFVSWVREGDGLRAFWLDGRAMADGGPMSVRTAAVGAGPAAHVGPVELLDDRVCECCSTDAAVAASGPYVVYRDRSEGEVRDVFLAGRSEAGWSEPRAVHADGWQLQGCPVNGPETDADGERVVAAWFTAAEGRGEVRAVLSSDGGASFGEPVVIDSDGPLGRVDAVLDGQGGALVSWLARSGERAAIRVVRLDGDGILAEPLTVAETSSARASGFPRLVRRGDAAYLAWVDLEVDRPSRIRLRRLPLEAIPG